MNLIKWGLIFAVAFSISFGVIFTFTQPQFAQLVSAKFFYYQTKPYPIYMFVASALGIGLAAGLCIAAYYFISLQSKLFSRDRHIKKLETELSEARQTASLITAPSPNVPPSNP